MSSLLHQRLLILKLHTAKQHLKLIKLGRWTCFQWFRRFVVDNVNQLNHFLLLDDKETKEFLLSVSEHTLRLS